jgi:ASC-1-like (ASCH) protein
MSEGAATFRFDLDPEFEEAVREGAKTIDVRVNIAPYADVNKGDIIRYRSAEVRVRAIRAYPCLHDVVSYEDFRKIVPDASNPNEAHQRLMEVFPGDEASHNMLVFEITFLPGRHGGGRRHQTKRQRKKS